MTGAGSGIGRGCALRLAADGASVVLADLESSGGEDTVDQIAHPAELLIFKRPTCGLRMSASVSWKRLFASSAASMCFVNNAGIYPRSTLEQTTEEFWDQMLAINLKGPFFLCKHAVPFMRQRGGGSIVNMGSVHGLGGAGNLFAYSVSKGGLLTMTKNLAVALAHERIRVNYLIPGWVLSRTEIEIQPREGRDEDWLKHKGEQFANGSFSNARRCCQHHCFPGF